MMKINLTEDRAFRPETVEEKDRYVSRHFRHLMGELARVYEGEGKLFPDYVLRRAERTDEYRREILGKAIYDDLTGLYNSYAAKARVSNNRRRMANGYSVVFIDLDGFKRANDECGHEIGNGVLKIMGQTLKRYGDMFLPGSVAGREGGDEFVLFLPGTPEAGAGRVVEKLRTYFTEAMERYADALEHKNPGRDYSPVRALSFSAGNAQFHDTGDLDDAVKRADGSMYKDKQIRNGKKGAGTSRQ